MVVVVVVGGSVTVVCTLPFTGVDLSTVVVVVVVVVLVVVVVVVSLE